MKEIMIFGVLKSGLVVPPSLYKAEIKDVKIKIVDKVEREVK